MKQEESWYGKGQTDAIALAHMKSLVPQLKLAREEIPSGDDDSTQLSGLFRWAMELAIDRMQQAVDYLNWEKELEPILKARFPIFNYIVSHHDFTINLRVDNFSQTEGLLEYLAELGFEVESTEDNQSYKARDYNGTFRGSKIQVTAWLNYGETDDSCRQIYTGKVEEKVVRETRFACPGDDEYDTGERVR